MLGAWDTGLDANGPSIEELPACVESSMKKIVSGKYGSQTTAFRKKKNRSEEKVSWKGEGRRILRPKWHQYVVLLLGTPLTPVSPYGSGSASVSRRI